MQTLLLLFCVVFITTCLCMSDRAVWAFCSASAHENFWRGNTLRRRVTSWKPTPRPEAPSPPLRHTVTCPGTSVSLVLLRALSCPGSQFSSVGLIVSLIINASDSGFVWLPVRVPSGHRNAQYPSFEEGRVDEGTELSQTGWDSRPRSLTLAICLRAAKGQHFPVVDAAGVHEHGCSCSAHVHIVGPQLQLSSTSLVIKSRPEHVDTFYREENGGLMQLQARRRLSCGLLATG